MEVSSHYTEIQEDSSVARRGGLTLKGFARTSRQPVHMILLVDSSGSMETYHKMDNVKQSILMLVSLLNSNDRISLVTFSDNSNIILSKKIPTPEEQQAIQYRVESIRPDGSTNMSAALLDARTLVEPLTSQRKQGILLLTDGIANKGVTSKNGLLDIVQRIQTESPGVSVTTVAYGSEHNSDILTDIARTGGGAYNVVKDLEDVACVFGDILGGLSSVAAQKVEVQFPLGSEVDTQYKVKKMDNGETIVYIGDLYADTEVNVLFKHSPAMGEIVAKGIDMNSLDTIQTSINPILLGAVENVPVNLLIAEYRNKVSRVLSELNGPDREVIRQRVQTLLDSIQTETSLHEHPLRAILMEDLQNALQILQRNNRITADENAYLSQHAAYLGMTRGLRTVTGQQYTQIDSNQASPFANVSQTEYVRVMRSITEQRRQTVQEDPSSAV